MDIESFISEIQCRPAIWDSKSECYNSRGEKVKAWEEIAELFVANFSNKNGTEKNIAVTKLQRKWKSLRDCFNREYAKKCSSEPSSSRQYIYYKHLSFLNGLKDEIPPTDVVPEDETKKVETPRPQINRKYIKRTVDIEENKIPKTPSKKFKLKYETIDNVNDPDRQFLMSMLPHVKRIDESSKLDFQSDMLQLIRKYQNQSYDTYPAQYYGCPENTDIPTQNSAASWVEVSAPIVQPSPSHSNCSNQSRDSSIVEEKYHDDDESDTFAHTKH